MIQAQEWLDKEYPKKQRKEIKKLDISGGDKEKNEKKLNWEKLTGHLDLSDFVNLEDLDCSRNKLASIDVSNCLNLKNIECYDNQLSELVLTNLTKLESLVCNFNQLTSLNLSGLTSLRKLYCRDNYLTDTDFLLTLPRPEKLVDLSIRDNNINEQNLTVFSKLVNLKWLWVGNSNKEKIEQGVYNRFIGSLKPLKSLKNLCLLYISNTDIIGDWECLPESLEEIYSFGEERPKSKVKDMSRHLQWISKDFTIQQLKAWLGLNLQASETGLAVYLAKRGYQPHTDLNLEELKKEYNKNQGWLDKNYPPKTRNKIREIYLNKPNLEGELDLKDFTYNDYHERGVKIYISSSIDESKLTFKNLPEKSEIIKLKHAQTWLENQEEYNTKEKRKQIIELDISDKNLEEDLDLSDFVNLRELKCCWNNRLTSLNVSSCSQLKSISCRGNLLTNLVLPTNPTNLKELYLSDNNFPVQDLSFLIPYNNLEELSLSNHNKEKIWQGIYNRFTGSLDYLSGMKNLKVLDISDTDLNEVNIKKLPRSLKRINYSTKKRPNCQLRIIVSQLEKIWYGHCYQCQKINTSFNWCQPCAEQKWQEDIKNLSGQDVIKKFIQQQDKKHSQLQWIPYEQFSNIEYLVEGGFSKIYKAEWKEIEKHCIHYSSEDVVLKVLNNSQNITLEFLTEIVNNKLVDHGYDSNIVTCYGLSQDTQSKNYIIVLDYKKNGNLRDCLRNNESKLNWENKLHKICCIANGLKSIHWQGLVHRDLHGGNILNDDDWSYITDLGLSKPINYQREERKIFGVLPYVAPEVLQEFPYTQASDVYSFAMISYEVLVGLSPFYEYDHDPILGLRICQGLRPQFPIEIPPLLKDLIKRCWSAEPKQRPTTEELNKTLSKWSIEVQNKESTELTRQIKVLEKSSQDLSDSIRYLRHKTHSRNSYCSRPINTGQIMELLKIQTQLHNSQNITLELDKLNVKEDPCEQSSVQNQIQVPPK